MRTLIAPLHQEVQRELGALDRRRAQIARQYIRRLALEPYLGARVKRGLLAEYGCRRIHFDRHDRPDDLFGARHPTKRRGDEDLGEGPRWRIVYWPPEAPGAEIRLVIVLAIAPGPHETTGPERLQAREPPARGAARPIAKERRIEMNAFLISAAAYHRIMSDDGLPHPARGMRVSELHEHQSEVLEMLEQDGAIVVHTDDGEHLLGVLTRDRRLLDEASIAAMIDTGNLPPLAELLAMDDRGELP